MKRILLAGASGIIGSFISEPLNKKYDLVKLSNSKSIDNSFIKLNLLSKSEIEMFVKSNKKFDSIIFLVGLAHKNKIFKNELDYQKINFTTLKNFLDVFQKYKKKPTKIIFISTIAVYNEKLKIEFYDEDSEISQNSFYSKTKIEAENYLMQNFKSSSWILRLAPVYSSGFSLNIQRRTKILNFGYKVGKGNKKLSLCNIENIKSVIDSIINDKVPNGVYNISDPVEYNYNQLIGLYKVKKIFKIPIFFLKGIYFISKLLFLKRIEEYVIKLISNNVYSSKKIRKYVSLEKTLFN